MLRVGGVVAGVLEVVLVAVELVLEVVVVSHAGRHHDHWRPRGGR